METHDSNFADCVKAAIATVRTLPDADVASFSERLSALTFVLLDSLDELDPGAKGGDLQSWFRRHAAGFATAFRTELRVALLYVTDAPDIPGLNRFVVDTSGYRYLLSEVVIRLIDASLGDGSDDRARSAALIDKSVSFWSTLSVDAVPQRLVELIKYSYQSGFMSLSLFGSACETNKDGEHEAQTGHHEAGEVENG